MTKRRLDGSSTKECFSTQMIEFIDFMELMVERGYVKPEQLEYVKKLPDIYFV